MILTQHFSTDFDLLTAGLRKGYRGEPYAFVRFGDGEYAIMRGQRHVAKSDGWIAPAGDGKPNHWRLLGGRLVSCLWESLPGFCMGITAHEHHPDCFDWLIANSMAAVDKTTYAEIFIFANYQRFLAIDLSDCILVGPNCGLFDIPRDAVMTGWDHRSTVDLLIKHAGAPILVAAGPMANIIIHDYWLRCPPERKRVILDVGSAISSLIHGRRTRSYHKTGHPQRSWTPRFWPAG